MANRYFTRDTFNFLSALAANNRREWFDEHKPDYEATVRTPSLNFIRDIATDLALISPHFLALPRKVGGALMRVNRDIRFGNDKRPYKTNIGIQFRHEVGKDVHAPGFYLHIEPNDCFVAIGLWRPDASALSKIRDAIVNQGEAWLAARDDKNFNQKFSLAGATLTNAPRGYAKDHPLLSDLKRKDFIAIAPLRDAEAISKDFYPKVVEHYAQAAPFMRYLCKALELRF
ncbi:DUF2461 domain-containing protein [Sulfurirhabdus autotrophica]|uniref:Uncharacterized protein (TIGR02453 family) n=1 Tax=Sulfurirhabdus autotrophica TaxID=1706046 RepID=A0A4R3Y2P4_9PROT|nr:DUF2461 domain-containing protein [Sulfurirhabdus autotrophica]TCV85847.1 uncharacterized protein (TIGR02453 family) [Sulfurirhabdus autotrophica]